MAAAETETPDMAEAVSDVDTPIVQSYDLDLTSTFLSYPALLRAVEVSSAAKGFRVTPRPKAYFNELNWPYQSKFSKSVPVPRRGWFTCSPRSACRALKSHCPWKIVFAWESNLKAYVFRAELCHLSHNHELDPPPINFDGGDDIRHQYSVAEMERKLQGIEDRWLLRPDQDVGSAVATGNNGDPNHEPMMGMLYRMEQKIESLQNRIDGCANDSNFPNPASTDAASAGVTADAPPSYKRKRGTPPNSPYAHQPKRPSVDDNDESLASPSKSNDIDEHPTSNNTAAIDTDVDVHKTKKLSRINWFKSPHRERLARVLEDWWSRTGLALDDETKNPITCLRKYSEKTGIPRTTLFKYLHKDPSKRRVISAEEGVYGGRGKKPLIDDEGVRFVVAELKSKAEASDEGFSRQEAVGMIMERFGLSQMAASRQLTRRILPVLMKDGTTSLVDDEATSHDNQQHRAPDGGITTQQQQPRRSIVISGVTSGLGRALFGYYCAQGHDVAGCGGDHEEIRSLQLEFPHAWLSVVNVTDDDAVRRWAAQLEGDGMEADVVVAAAEVCPEADRNVPAWEVPGEDFDKTIDVNVKGVSNMVRHFVPRLIRTHCTSGSIEGGGGAFVAMSSGFGRSPNPRIAAFCASKFAIEGMMKSVAMSLPVPLCAVPLAPGLVSLGEEEKTTSRTAIGDMNHQQHCNPYTNNHVGGDKFTSNGLSNDINRWVHVAGTMILRLNRKDNGRSMSVNGFHSLRDRQSWIIQDGTGVPNMEI